MQSIIYNHSCNHYYNVHIFKRFVQLAIFLCDLIIGVKSIQSIYVCILVLFGSLEFLIPKVDNQKLSLINIIMNMVFYNIIF